MFKRPNKQLTEALLDTSATNGGICIKPKRNPLLGLIFVTSAALLFGVVAACVKATALPTLILQLCRSIIEWGLGIVAALSYSRGAQLPEPQVMPESAPAKFQSGSVLHKPSPAPSPRSGSTTPGASDQPTDLTLLLFGPAHLRGWLVLRAALYWIFLAGWWFALTSMPIGDATTIVYVGPIFTATFAYLFLGEHIDWSFYPIVVLDGMGLLLITQPTFVFGGSAATSGRDEGAYYLGALSAFISAIVAGLLPVCTRKSKACFWTAVNHFSSALSATVFTPLAIVIWYHIDPSAPQQVAASLSEVSWLRSEFPRSEFLRPITRLLLKFSLLTPCPVPPLPSPVPLLPSPVPPLPSPVPHFLSTAPSPISSAVSPFRYQLSRLLSRLSLRPLPEASPDLCRVLLAYP